MKYNYAEKYNYPNLTGPFLWHKLWFVYAGTSLDLAVGLSSTIVLLCDLDADIES